MEGGMVDHVSRLLSGKQLYTEPSIEFTPFIYTPLFYYLGMIFSKILGTGFLSLRCISLFASFGSFIIIFKFVRKETQSLICAFASIGLFAATYRIGGAWLDLARVDSLFLLFLLWGVYLLRFHESTLSLITSGILIFLSFFTKQSAIVVGISMSVYSFIYLYQWKKLLFPATVLLCLTMSTLVMNWVSQGWYSYYVFDLPLQHKMLPYQIIVFWIRDMKDVSIALVISVCYCFILLRRPKRKTNGYYIIFLVGMIGTSWLSRIHSGSYNNDLLPAYVALAIFFGLAIQAIISGSVITRFLRQKNALPQDMRAINIVVFIACLAQFHVLVYNPFDVLPSREDLKAGDAFVNRVKEIKGEVFIPCHGYLSSLAGKKSHAHWMAIGDVLRGNDELKKTKLCLQLVEAVSCKQFGAIILDNDISEIENELALNYRLTPSVFNSRKVFWPITGAQTRPELFYEISN